jgi:outer membrane protein assembly factor BamA
VREAIRSRLALAAAAFAVALAVGAPAWCDAGAAAPADSSTAFPKKRSSRSGWERAVNAPFELAYLPLGLTFDAIRAGIVYTSRHHLVKAVREFLISDDGRTGVVPIATPSKGGGAKFFHRGWISPNSKLSIHAQVGLANRQDYGVELKRVVLFQKLNCGFFAGYEFDTDEHFFGFGMRNDPEDDETDFTRELAQAELRVGTAVGDRLQLDSVLGIEHDNILEARGSSTRSTVDIYAPAELPGVADQQVRLWHASLAVDYDTRDRVGSPTRGWLVSTSGGYWADVQEDRYEFWKFKADVRTYLDLFYRRVLMLRVATEVTEEVSGAGTPFYHLSELGRYGSIRGFSNGRFRGNDALMATLEYSWPIGRGMDFLLFGDAGEVMGRLDDFKVDRAEVGWGGGLRVFSQKGAVAKLEFGKSREEWRLYFVLN